MHRPNFFDESQHQGHGHIELPGQGGGHHDSTNAFQRENQQHLDNHSAHKSPYAEGNTNQHGHGLGHGHEHGRGHEHGYGHEHGRGHEHGYGHEHGRGHEHGYGHGHKHQHGLPDLEIHDPSRPNHHKGGGPGEHYDSHVSGDAAHRILQAAHADKGRPMWQQTDHGASGANEGCAASLSAVLRQAGVSHANAEDVHGLQSQLEREGWTRTSTPRPGDAVFGYGGRSKAHCGIVDENHGAMYNHSSTGRWSNDNLSYFNNWNQRVFLRPPA